MLQEFNYDVPKYAAKRWLQYSDKTLKLDNLEDFDRPYYSIHTYILMKTLLLTLPPNACFY